MNAPFGDSDQHRINSCGPVSHPGDICAGVTTPYACALNGVKAPRGGGGGERDPASDEATRDISTWCVEEMKDRYVETEKIASFDAAPYRPAVTFNAKLHTQ